MLKAVCGLAFSLILGACAPFQSFVDDSPRDYYLVQPDDNLFSIAFVLETTPGAIRRANPWLNPVYLEPGSRLLIPQYQQDDLLVDDYQSYQYEQKFRYESTQARASNSGFIWPLKKIDVSSHFGRRRGRLHSGIDLRAPKGTPILASAAGRVIFSGYNRGYGRLVIIKHGDGFETAYAHNNRNLATKGQRVKQGQQIATVGRTGNATGNHVHFEFRRYGNPLNPLRLLQVRQ